MRKLFARYTSDAVVDEILSAGEVVLTGEKREVTVLFADIRNFTALAETLPPEQVMGVLNEVLGRLADAVLTCGGTLDKFLGDGLMAVFGAPVAHETTRARAVRVPALQMHRGGAPSATPRRERPDARAWASASTRASSSPATSAARGAPSTPASATR